MIRRKLLIITTLLCAITIVFGYSSKVLAQEEPLPSYVDNSLRDAFPPIRSQKYGSCVAFAITYYQLGYEMALAKGWNNKNNDNSIKFSPKWTFNFTVYEILKWHGAATWEDWPYDSNYKEWPLDPNVWRNAINYRIDDYALYWDEPENLFGIENVKKTLAEGRVLVITIVGGGNWPYKRIKDDPSTEEDDFFVGEKIYYGNAINGAAHAVTIVGYNDNIWVDLNDNNIVEPNEKGAFKIANSWGTGWGNKGFFWMAYSARERWVGDKIYVKKDYSPKLLAEVTVSTNNRKMYLAGGFSDLNKTLPETLIGYPVFFDQRVAPLNFKGETDTIESTFFLDFTDFLSWFPQGEGHFYLVDVAGRKPPPFEIKSFILHDLIRGEKISWDGVSISSSPSPYKVHAYCDAWEWEWRTGSNIIVYVTRTFGQKYKITASAQEGGTITPSGEIYVNEGESQTFTIQASQGYEYYRG